MFQTDKSSAESALQAFLPKAGREYAVSRNFDPGPDQRDNISMLSPWVRLRLLPEWTICRTVLSEQSRSQAAKFIDEVCWRTYWKSWLEGRPQVWSNYLEALAEDRARYGDDPTYQRAIRGETGIDCMDAWASELVETGYLHNHARMWFASIWTHTLKLPWTLGAAFFLKHLLDGDPASNTLSWRWVAGLHTAGKSYLATRNNIRKYTDERFEVNAELATEPVNLTDYAGKPSHQTVEPLPRLPKSGRIGLLLHDDDLSGAEWLAEKASVQSIAACFPESTYAGHGIAEPVVEFRRQCLRSALADPDALLTNSDAVLEWAQANNLQHVVMAQPFVGLWDAVTPEIRQKLQAHGIELTTGRHWWDEHFLPHAKAGFFRFKKAIPAAIEQL